MPELLRAGMPPSTSGHSRTVDRWFYVGVALAMILLNILAFTPSLVDPSARNAPLPLTSLLILHTLASVGWLLLFLAQSTLAATARVEMHRRLGLVGVALSFAFVALAALAVLAQARRGFDLSGDIGRLPLPSGVDGLSATVALLYFPVQFAILVGAALWHRKRPALHKRLMLFAVLGGLTPTPVAHMIGHWIGPQSWAGVLFPMSAIVLMSPIAVHDRRTQGRVHPMTLWLGALIVVSDQVFTLVVQRSAAWRWFAMWLVQ